MSEYSTILGDGRPKPAGTWDYYGDYDPAHFTSPQWMRNFSVRVFQWEHAPWSGSGKLAVKKGKAVKRFSGSVDKPQQVYSKALAYIKAQ